MSRRLTVNFIIVVFFSIAFAYIESSVVVYLREIFYSDGFDFPLNIFGVDDFGKRLLLTEIGREAATLVLILTACTLFGNNRRQRFAYFLGIFAVWDIFFYIWLKVLLGWPASVMDWDILFLIPLTWASPVLAPVIISLTMLGFALVILILDSKNIHIKPRFWDWAGFAGASVLAVAMFCHSGRFIHMEDYYTRFNWLGFSIAELIAIGLFTRSTFEAIKLNKTVQRVTN